ncbi:MAG TPA: S46 family peptidase [Pyrinomonadaceae bacterium]|nr:S46 family peptidase [Pyrinomonadaceae bacterium]
MKLTRHLRAALAALLLAATLTPAALAEEGMWAFNNLPRAEIKKRYGFEVTDDWVRRVQSATVRFPNGTGSFVSPEGLVLTNYHIVVDVVGELSTAERDLAKTGFVAHARDQEIKIPGLTLDQLVRIEDVTARVNGAAKAGMSDAEAGAARQAEIGRIQDEAAKATGMRADVVTLYQGGVYNLYYYKQYNDVRLVFAPEFQSAFFGGDPDNFNFPRYNLDMALVRVYEGGAPLKPENYFKWSQKGPQEGELTFVSGSPGTTQRLLTVAHLEYLRDVQIPFTVRMLESRRDSLKKYMAQGEEQTRRGQNELNYAENFIKVFRGELEGLRGKELLARKGGAEAALRAYAESSRNRKEYVEAWDTVARARKSLASYDNRRRLLGGSTLTDSPNTAFNTALFGHARALVRLAEESAKPDAERLPEFRDARRAALEAFLNSEAPVYEDLERMKLAASLSLMRDTLGADDALVRKVLAGKTPEARAAELISGTKLKDVAFRKELAAGGKKAVDASTDPLVVLARDVDAEARQLRRRYEEEVLGVERTAYGRVARVLFEKEGMGIYPDATFTPRLSYGAVKGYKENGKTVGPFTYFAGLYERSAQNGGKFPYNLPPRWVEKKSAVDMKVPFNFVTTNDIIGGNSGSPAFNREMELLGLIFDGNIQSLVGNFYYDESVNRAISVDSRGMLEALRKVYDAKAIADELARPSAASATSSR